MMMMINNALFLFSLILFFSSISTLAQSPQRLRRRRRPSHWSPHCLSLRSPPLILPPTTSQESSRRPRCLLFSVAILAPDDGAFSELKAGFLNSLNNGQKIELLQFHILPVFVASNNFDSLNNPVQTLAGTDNPARLQLNVTTMGDSVNITTGVVNATIKGIVYSDRQLAIYRLDKVLLPLDFVLSKSAPAAAPAGLAKTPKTDKEKPSEDDDSSDDTTQSKSAAVGAFRNQGTTLMSLGVALVVGATMWC